jgi:hypothetical protein
MVNFHLAYDLRSPPGYLTLPVVIVGDHPRQQITSCFVQSSYHWLLPRIPICLSIANDIQEFPTFCTSVGMT